MLSHTGGSAVKMELEHDSLFFCVTTANEIIIFAKLNQIRVKIVGTICR